MRWLLVAVSLVTVSLAAAPPSPAAEPGLTLEQAVTRALEKNAEILSLAAEIEAERARADGASRLLRSNPSLEAELGPRLRSQEDASLALELRLTQSVEIAGQRGARIDAASARVAAAEANLDARKNDLTAAVKARFAHALAARRRLELATEAQALAEQAKSAAEQRSRAGAAGQIEVNTARIEVGRATREHAEAERGLSVALGELMLLLAWDPSEDLQLAGELGATSKTPSFDLPALIAQAKRGRFELAVARSELAAAEAEQRLSGREGFPDLHVGAAYAREEPGTQIILGTLGIDLPLFDRNQARRGVSAARVAQTSRSLEAIERQVEREVRTAFARYTAARRAADAYAGDVATALEQNLELANEAYRAGKFDFFQLMLIRRETLEARRGHIDALEELASAEAELTRTAGGPP